MDFKLDPTPWTGSFESYFLQYLKKIGGSLVGGYYFPGLSMCFSYKVQLGTAQVSFRQT
jgi:hypothetical protein